MLAASVPWKNLVPAFGSAIFDDRAIALEPTFAPAFSLRASLLLRLGEMGVIVAKGLPTEALNEVEAEPGEVWRLLGMALVLHDLGQGVRSNAALQQLIVTHPGEPNNIASAYAYRGDLDHAFAWLDRAFDRRDLSLIEIRTDPVAQ